MGIKDLGAFLKKHADVEQQVHLSQFHGKWMAVDMGSIMYRYFKSAGEERWMRMILQFFTAMKKHRIKIVCVFDGSSMPIEKTKEWERRAKAAKSAENKAMLAAGAIEEIESEYMLSELAIPPEKLQQIMEMMGIAASGVDLRNPEVVLRILHDIQRRNDKFGAHLTTKHINGVKRLAKLMGIQCLQCDGEAEMICSYLCIRGDVDCILSDDSDALAYGAPIVARRISLKDSTVSVIAHQEMLTACGMNDAQFLDLCIMLGCDYNTRIKGYGVVAVARLIEKYKSIEGIIEANPNLNVESLNYIRCRELFTFADVSQREDKFTIEPMGDLDVEGLQAFFLSHDLGKSTAHIEKLYEPLVVVEFDEE